MMLDENVKSTGSGQGIVVVVVRHEARCAECGHELMAGNLLRVENEKLLCLDCADLGHLEFLGRGDAAITRRAGKYSALRAVAIKWSSARKRYERQGILAEPGAIERARQESLADADARALRQQREAEKRRTEDAQFIQGFAQAIRRQFPGCPKDEEASIAHHACLKHSRRVGRSAAAKQYDPEAVGLAVVAHVRHVHTKYDALLFRYGDRQLAREEVRDRVQQVLNRWQAGGK